MNDRVVFLVLSFMYRRLSFLRKQRLLNGRRRNLLIILQHLYRTRQVLQNLDTLTSAPLLLRAVRGNSGGLAAPTTYMLSGTRSSGWELHNQSWYWKEHFRMKKETFVRLVDLVAPEIHRRSTKRRGTICIARRVAIALWRLAGCESYREIAAHFDVGKSTCVTITREFCQALNRLSGRLIKFPSNCRETARAIARFQDACSIPQALGVIGGTHIEITTPQNAVDYFDREHLYSVTTQAVIGEDLVFLDAAIGYPGGMHDTRVLRCTQLFRKAENGAILNQPAIKISGTQIRPLLLGDETYPLLPSLIKPFPDNVNLASAQRRLNQKLTSASSIGERAFGVLKGRWRILLNRLDCRFANAPKVILSCCILHNICQEAGDEFDDEELIQRVIAIERRYLQTRPEQLNIIDQEAGAEEVRRVLVNC